MNSKMIPFRLNGFETNNGITQTITIGKLGESHDTKVVGTGQRLNILIALKLFDDGLKSPPRHEIHYLRKIILPIVHVRKSPEKNENKIEVDAGLILTQMP